MDTPKEKDQIDQNNSGDAAASTVGLWLVQPALHLGFGPCRGQNLIRIVLVGISEHKGTARGRLGRTGQIHI